MQKIPKTPSSTRDSYGTSDISRLCGVSATTAAHWIDEGKMPAHTTLGGHRRVRREDLEAFMRAYRFPIPPELEKSGLAVIIIGNDPADRARTALAVHGQCPGARILEAGGAAELKRRLKGFFKTAFLVFCLAACPLAAHGQKSVTYGAESDVNSRYVWHGIAWSRAAVLNPSAWVGVSGLTASYWQNYVMGEEANRGQINEFDLSLSYAWQWHGAGVEPFFEFYNYPHQADSPATGMLGVTITVPLGPLHLFAKPSCDVVGYAGATILESGLSYEGKLSDSLSVKAALEAGAGSPRFNDVYLEKHKGAFNYVGAELELNRRFGKACFLRPHAAVTRLIDGDLRLQVERPALLTGGIAIGVEF